MNCLQPRLGNVWMENVTAVTEGGCIISGSPHSPLYNIGLKNVTLLMRNLTNGTAATRDFRPGGFRITHMQVPAFFLEHAENVNFTDVVVRSATSRLANANAFFSCIT